MTIAIPIYLHDENRKNVRPTPERPLYFRHIPKTAGSSVRVWLFHNLGPANLCQIGMIDQLFWPGYTHDRYSVFSMHGQGYLDPVLGRSTIQCTVLREPVARVFSEWNQIRRAESHPQYERVIKQDFASFIEDEQNEYLIRNVQARHLSPPRMDVIAERNQMSEDDLRNYRLSERLLEASLKWSDNELAQNADKALSEMLVVGTTDNLGAFLSRLAQRMGISAPSASSIPRVNTNPNPRLVPILPRHLMRRLMSLTEVDRALYNRFREEHS